MLWFLCRRSVVFETQSFLQFFSLKGKRNRPVTCHFTHTHTTNMSAKPVGWSNPVVARMQDLRTKASSGNDNKQALGSRLNTGNLSRRVQGVQNAQNSQPDTTDHRDTKYDTAPPKTSKQATLQRPTPLDMASSIWMGMTPDFAKGKVCAKSDINIEQSSILCKKGHQTLPKAKLDIHETTLLFSLGTHPIVDGARSKAAMADPASAANAAVTSMNDTSAAALGQINSQMADIINRSRYAASRKALTSNTVGNVDPTTANVLANSGSLTDQVAAVQQQQVLTNAQATVTNLLSNLQTLGSSV